MKLLDNYLDLQQDIYDYFEYDEKWSVYPIDDSRDHYWFIDRNSVVFCDKPFDRDVIVNGLFYTGVIDDSIYTKEDFTMIQVDTQTDGNIFLQIFDNSKKVILSDTDLTFFREW